MVTIPNFETILQELEASQGLEGIQDNIVRIRGELQIDHLVYHWVDSAGEQYGCGTYTDEWRQRYIDKVTCAWIR